MSCLRVSVSALCFSLMFSVTAPAQETDELRTAASPEPDEEVWAVVRGLSAGDLLNVRADASPLGRTIGRLPNGAMVRKLECRVFDRYEWCRVDAAEADGLSGWTPARYLSSTEADDTETAAAAGVAGPAGDEPMGAADRPSPAPDDAPRSSVPIPQPAPRPEAPAVTGTASREAGVTEEDTVSALPPGLEARFAGGSALPIDAVRTIERRAPTPPAENPDAEAVPTENEPAEGARQEAASDDGERGIAAPGVPVPTPRPGRPAEAAPEPETPEPIAVAEVGPSADEPAPLTTSAAGPRQDGRASLFDATDEIPCARYPGQPMARCIVRVVRTGTDAADITVVWPDGGTRLIAFRDGAPASSNSRAEFRFTREGTLNMIRIGASERFEILDALAFDD